MNGIILVDHMRDCRVEMLYGVRVMRPMDICTIDTTAPGVKDLEVEPQPVVMAAPRCAYCGLFSSGGVVRCLNCGAPK